MASKRGKGQKRRDVRIANIESARTIEDLLTRDNVMSVLEEIATNHDSIKSLLVVAIDVNGHLRIIRTGLSAYEAVGICQKIMGELLFSD